MSAVHVIKDPGQLAVLAAPLRQRILEALEEPGSASSVAKRLGLARQKVAYHVRQLEANGYLRLVREERRRGCTERIVQRSAQYLVASNEVFGRLGIDPQRLQNKFSSEYLIALAGQVAREVGEAQTAAERAGKPLPTLSTQVEIRLRSPQEREAFGREVVEAVAQIAAKYHDAKGPDGRSYRLVLGAYPIRERKP